MFKSSTFDKSLESATSNLRLEIDWQSIMVICDTIRQNDVTPKYAVAAIKKKMYSQNPHTALFALMVLESMVKNCGAPVHEEIANKTNCEMYANLVGTTLHENVRNKMLELVQTWAFAFRTNYKYRGIKDTMNILKTEGHKFPEMKESDAMFSSDVAPEWADGEVCHRCRTAFSFTSRKHHCRNCGQVFCNQCSSKTSMLPKFGIEKEVRVCDGCHVLLQKPLSAPGIATPKMEEPDELPAEYLKSSLAQQNQNPVRKTDEELREEEELQLALALSQSEAETKKKMASASTRRTYPKSPSPERQRSPSPVEEQPTDPEMARYLNRNYWEQRQMVESPASPSAPSPMPSQTSIVVNPKAGLDHDIEIHDFSQMMKTQVEIFVNRMKSNSSRGRSISNDTSVQSLFMNLTSLHSRLLTYIKDMDDKRMWHEQLQDKLNQVKDSRAALDVLRQEHQEKLRRIAEEAERQRQMQMAHKLEIMRKKKQEYLQYQRQLALQRIQEQEREMLIRQEQQKAQYRMGSQNFGYMPPGSAGGQQGSPAHIPGAPNHFGYNQMPPGQMPNYSLPGQNPPGMMFQPPPGLYQNNSFMPINPAQGHDPNNPNNMIPNSMPASQMHHNQQQMMMHPPGQGQQMAPMYQQPGVPQDMQQHPGMMANQQMNQQMPPIPQQNQGPPPQQMQPGPFPVAAPLAVPQAVQDTPAPAKQEIEEAQLISFD